MASELTNSLWLPPPRGGGSFFSAGPLFRGRPAGVPAPRGGVPGGILWGVRASGVYGRTDRGPVLCRLPASQP